MGESFQHGSCNVVTIFSIGLRVVPLRRLRLAIMVYSVLGRVGLVVLHQLEILLKKDFHSLGNLV
jgi:hypothetical protein